MEASTLRAKMAVEGISSFVNAYNPPIEEFCNIMKTEHRTLQQAFTKLALRWIETAASNDYRTDGRNEASHNVCKTLIDGFTEVQRQNGFTGATLQMMSHPSSHLPMV